MDNSLKKINQFLVVWIFFTFIIFSAFSILYLQNVDASPVATNAFEVEPFGTLILRNVKTDINKRELNVPLGQTMTFDIELDMLTDENYNEMQLIIQYPYQTITPTQSGAFTFSDKYIVEDGDFCSKIDNSYNCMVKKITLKNGGSFIGSEKLGTIRFEAIKINSNKTISLFPADELFDETKNSYLQDPHDRTKSIKFIASELSSMNINVVDTCLGDYNQMNGINEEIVDLEDLSTFSKFFGKPLMGEDKKYDLINTDGENILNAADMNIFISNYGKRKCAIKASDL